MEARALLKRALEDAEKLGLDYKIEITKRWGDKLYFYDYSLLKTQETETSSYFSKEKMEHHDITSLEQLIILASGTILNNYIGYKRNVVPEDCMIKDVVRLWKKNKPERVKEYRLMAEKSVSNEGIEVPMLECCEQDLVIFGEDHYALVSIKTQDEKEIITDWLLGNNYTNEDPEFIENETKFNKMHNKDEFTRYMTLKDLYDQLLRQEKGEYDDIHKARIIKVDFSKNPK